MQTVLPTDPVVEDLDTQCAIATDDVDLHPCLSTWADWGAVQRDFFVIGVDGAEVRGHVRSHRQSAVGVVCVCRARFLRAP